MGGACQSNTDRNINRSIDGGACIIYSNQVQESVNLQAILRESEIFFEKVLQNQDFEKESQLEQEILKQEQLFRKQIQRLELIIKEQEESINSIQFLDEKNQNLEQNDDQLEINISYFYKQKHSQPIDYPCKHSQCLQVATLNCKGIVNCKNGCPSYNITDAVFEVSKNQVFNKLDQNKFGTYFSIQSAPEMVTIINDSIQKSKMNEAEQNEFCKNFSSVLFQKFVKSKIK